MRKFIFIFIFIITSASAQDNYFWNDIGVPLEQVFMKMGIPDDIEYQDTTGVYWMGYDFGDIAVIYIVNKGFVWNIIYIKNTKDYTNIDDTYLKIYNMAKKDNFLTSLYTDEYYTQTRNDTKISGNINVIKNEFVLTILVSKFKK